MKAKNRIGMLKKKHFIGLIIGICVVALFAEAMLLIHTFSGKEKDKKEKKTKQEEPSVTVTAVPDGEDAPKKTSRPVIRIDRQYETDGSGKKLLKTEYEYDEKGRETRRVCYADDGQVAEVISTVYDRNGCKAETRTGSETGTLYRTVFTDLAGDTYDIIHASGEEYECKYNSEGFRTELIHTIPLNGGPLKTSHTWEYDEDGYLIRTSEYDLSEGRRILCSSKEYSWNDSGRVARIVEKNSDGDPTSETRITYDGTRKTFDMEAYIGFTRQMVIEYEGNLETSIRYRMADGTSEEVLVAFPKGNYPESIVDFLRSGSITDYDEDGAETRLATLDYTSNGQPLRQYYGSDEKVAMEFSYDGKGNLTQCVYRNNFGKIYEDYRFVLDEDRNMTEFRDEMQGTAEFYEWRRIMVEEE